MSMPMGCLDGNCSGVTCKPDLVSPHFPPKVNGWRLVGWPDFVPVKFRELLGGQSVTWEGNTHTSVINSILRILKANKVAIVKEELCAWANAQWCASDPDRCRSMSSSSARLELQRQSGLVANEMLWATPFWRLANVSVSSPQPDSEARGMIELLATQAKALLAGEFGCSKCAAHFDLLSAKYPTDRILTWKQARVWLWQVHNESRDSGKVVPYSEIATIYGWEQLTDSEIAAIILSLTA